MVIMKKITMMKVAARGIGSGGRGRSTKDR